MNGYPVCHHDPCSSCPRFGSLDTDVTENRFSMVVEHRVVINKNEFILLSL